ncbi:MAG: amidohydrolase family protein [Candidatus Riflebacteria bacterium]|nr:amidohydrolase family protein [Candidatus Riflebacteria bacterium]
MSSLVVVGTVLQTPTPRTLAVSSDVAVVVGDDGVIEAVHPAASMEAKDAWAAAPRVQRLNAHERLLPGLIDLHVHAPQWPQLGTGLDLGLEKWLFDYTFPLEVRYADAGFALEVWDRLVPTLLRHGTTTAVYFSSIHEEATRLLAATCVRHGQRAFVGRVAMDHPEGTPRWYRDVDAKAGVAASAASIETIAGLPGARGLVAPIITPRFIPTCTDELLSGLGELAASTGALVQTHCSESDWEHGHVLERFGRRDAWMLQQFGLMRRGTVLAHGNLLDDGDFGVIRSAAAGVAHCPLSNSYFSNAVFPLRRALQQGVAVGLGSDVAGGAHPGLLPQCGHAVTVSRMLEDGVDGSRGAAERGVPGSRVDVVTAFHAATVGGASVLGIPAGLLAPGKLFDAFVVRTNDRESGLHVYEGLDDEARIFEKIVRLAAPSDIPAVWVGGRRVVTR